MSFTLHIDSTNKIIHYKHSGSLNYDAIGEAWSELLKLKEFTQQQFNLLSDYSDATFAMQLNETQNIVNFLSQLKPILNQKKQAIIVTDPYSTAGTILFQSKAYNEIGFIIKIFSTKKAALKWLKS